VRAGKGRKVVQGSASGFVNGINRARRGHGETETAKARREEEGNEENTS